MPATTRSGAGAKKSASAAALSDASGKNNAAAGDGTPTDVVDTASPVETTPLASPATPTADTMLESETEFSGSRYRPQVPDGKIDERSYRKGYGFYSSWARFTAASNVFFRCGYASL